MCIPVLWIIIGVIILAGLGFALYPFLALYAWVKGIGAPR